MHFSNDVLAAGSVHAHRLMSTLQMLLWQTRGDPPVFHCRHTAMQPLKSVLYQIDESGSGRMSYHDFYVSLP